MRSFEGIHSTSARTLFGALDVLRSFTPAMQDETHLTFEFSPIDLVILEDAYGLGKKERSGKRSVGWAADGNESFPPRRAQASTGTLIRLSDMPMCPKRAAPLLNGDPNPNGGTSFRLRREIHPRYDRNRPVEHSSSSDLRAGGTRSSALEPVSDNHRNHISETNGGQLRFAEMPVEE